MIDAIRELFCCSSPVDKVVPNTDHERLILAKDAMRNGNVEKAHKLYSELASRKDPAMAGEGYYGLAGIAAKLRESPEKIVDYIDAAANLGHAEAQYEYGMMFKKGEMLTQNDGMAFSWFNMAANRGHIVAANAAGDQFTALFPDDQTGVAEDFFQQVVKLCKEKEQRNEKVTEKERGAAANANAELGKTLLNQPGKILNAIRHLELAAEQGNVEANFQLSKIYGKPSKNEETKKALEEIYDERKDSSNVVADEVAIEARFLQADQMMFGQDARTDVNSDDIKKARENLSRKLLFEQFCVSKASHHLAKALKGGHKQSILDRARHFEDSASQFIDVGDFSNAYLKLSDAMNQYDRIIKNGSTSPVDQLWLINNKEKNGAREYAVGDWLFKQGDKKKNELTDDIRRTFFVESVKYLKLAATAGNVKACFKLGEMYEEGKVVPRNIELASYYYEQAIAFNKVTEKEFQIESNEMRKLSEFQDEMRKKEELHNKTREYVNLQNDILRRRIQSGFPIGLASGYLE